MPVRIICITLFAIVLAASGCSSSTDTPDPGTTEKATISLPAGWPMEDAISADEVGAITGESMVLFPEAGSSAQSGRPSCGYTIAAVSDSKILFSTDVQGGAAGFENLKQFAEAGSIQDVTDVGDQAFVCTFSDGRKGIVVLKGDAVLRIDWNPAVYSEDPGAFGTRLAAKTLEGMFQ